MTILNWLLNWFWPILFSIGLLLATGGYLHGWRRLHAIFPGFATWGRLAAYSLGILLLTLAFVFPLMWQSQYHLFARSLQKVFLAMIAPAMLWVSCPIHIAVWGLPSRTRRFVSSRILANPRLHKKLRPFTQPGLAWLFFVMTFVIWHEPHYLAWTMQTATAHYASALWLLGAALLYWSHIIYTGLRTHTRLSGWFVFVYLLGVEIPNMFIGVSMAFSSAPLYEYYVHVQTVEPFTDNTLQNILMDQMLSGGLIWVVGSMVYISAIVLVFNRLFKLEKGLPPVLSANREADERWIAPGLEYRVVQNRWRQVQSEKPKP